MLKVGIWGYGGIATIHRRSYAALEEAGVPVKLVALCDIREEQFTKEIKINISTGDDKPLPKIDKCYTDIDEMLANEELDMIDICLPAYMHKDAAIKCLKAGYHVLSEKPMALSYADCCEMIETAKTAKGKLLIGQCLRHDLNYNVLKDAIDSGKYGKVINANFHRLSGGPIWAWENWYMDINKSGGVNFDLHIHDIDMTNYLFGTPKTVTCFNTGNPEKFSGRDTAFTTFTYDNGVVVSGHGDWCQPGKYQFSYRYTITFENATLEFKDYKLTKITEDSYEDITVPDPFHNIAKEIRAFVEAIENGTEVECAPVESTANTLKILEFMMESSNAGGKMVDFK